MVVTERPREYLKRIEAEVQAKEAEMYHGNNRRGPQPKGKSQDREVQEKKRLNDPESGLLGRPGKSKGFHYLCHQSADMESGIVTDVHVTAGNRTDHECCVERVRTQIGCGMPMREFVADEGYDILEVHHLLGEMGISVYVLESLSHEGFRRNSISAERFLFDEEKNMYSCPGGGTQKFSYYAREGGYVFALYRSGTQSAGDVHYNLAALPQQRNVESLNEPMVRNI